MGVLELIFLALISLRRLMGVLAPPVGVLSLWVSSRRWVSLRCPLYAQRCATLAPMGVLAPRWVSSRRDVGAAFFALTLSPTLGFVDFIYMEFSLVADRYAYLAGIGAIAVCVGAAAHFAGGLPRAARVGAAGVLVAVLAERRPFRSR